MKTNLFNWGNAIALTFFLFANFIGIMVYFMTSERIDLVREDYYQDELAYQNQIDKVANTAQLNTKLTVAYLSESKQLVLQIPTAVTDGKVVIYRPSDKRQDIQITLTPNTEGYYTLTTPQLSAGLWRVKVSWADEKARLYFAEQAITL